MLSSSLNDALSKNEISRVSNNINRHKTNNDLKHKILQITKDEYLSPIKDERVRQLSQLPVEELLNDGYNPGPKKPDGSVNFECHCVSHMVASPCGYDFRKAITCQQGATDAELEKGKCAEEFFEFMKCAMRTKCFRMKDGDDTADDSPSLLTPDNDGTD